MGQTVRPPLPSLTIGTVVLLATDVVAGTDIGEQGEGEVVGDEKEVLLAGAAAEVRGGSACT